MQNRVYELEEKLVIRTEQVDGLIQLLQVERELVAKQEIKELKKVRPNEKELYMLKCKKHDLALLQNKILDNCF